MARIRYESNKIILIMKKSALVLLVLTSFACEPEEVYCECTRTIFVRENYVETNPYKAVWLEPLPCKEDDLVWVIKDILFYTVTMKQ